MPTSSTVRLASPKLVRLSVLVVLMMPAVGFSQGIEHGTPKLLFASGIVGYQLTDDDRDFEAEYGVRFVDFGCVIPRMACLEIYNRTNMRYLDQTYGQDWRDHISVPAFSTKSE